MLLGIDVGGTYTDGVAVDDSGRILQSAKFPTNQGRLLASLTGCLDLLMRGIDSNKIQRVAISTTLLTNAILENNLEKTALAVIPGPGLSLGDQAYGSKPLILKGAVDFRGREIIPLDLEQVKETGRELVRQGYNSTAVCGKFSPRNNHQEKSVAAIFKQLCPEMKVELGHQNYGGFNFPRRANTAYLTAATRKIYQEFLTQVEEAVKLRGISAPLVILKADGGTLPLETAYRLPVETVYSGPAASILGVLALSEENETCGIIDIGGTTTDLGLILSGTPLYSACGAEIGRFKTLVRSFAVNSVAVGGDSPIEVRNGQLELGTRRRGPAFCLGGPAATPTDALRFLGRVEHGSVELASQAIHGLAKTLSVKPDQAAIRVIDLMVEKILGAFTDMVAKWQNEPAYRVWQVLSSRRLEQIKLVGVGGGAPGIVPQVAKGLKTDWVIPAEGAVANAIGAALAKPTFSCSLRADTGLKTYSIAETGLQQAWPYGLGTLAEAKKLLRVHFAERAKEMGWESFSGVVTREEVFNMVRGFYTEGKIIEVAMEQQAGVLARVSGRDVL